jgi:hypothetical protein
MRIDIIAVIAVVALGLGSCTVIGVAADVASVAGSVVTTTVSTAGSVAGDVVGAAAHTVSGGGGSSDQDKKPLR